MSRLVPLLDLGLPSDPSAAKSRVLIAVPPAIDRALDQATFPPQARVQFCKSPADRVAFCFVVEAIPLVVLLSTTSPRINTILVLEFGAERIHVHRLHITSDGILTLDSVPRILKRNPLHTITVLPHHQRGRGGNGSRSSARVDGRSWGLPNRSIVCSNR